MDPNERSPEGVATEIPFDVVEKMLPVTPRANIEANLPSVLAALMAADLHSLPVMLAALATIRAETEGFVPISEAVSRFNTSPGGHPFDRYDYREDLGNRGPPDGATYKGRGYVQLTGRANYLKFGRLVGEPGLADTPDLANSPDIAGRLLASFLWVKQGTLEAALARGDLSAARRLVNGGTNGLDRFAEAYRVGTSLMTSAVA